MKCSDWSATEVFSPTVRNLFCMLVARMDGDIHEVRGSLAKRKASDRGRRVSSAPSRHQSSYRYDIVPWSDAAREGGQAIRDASMAKPFPDCTNSTKLLQQHTFSDIFYILFLLILLRSSCSCRRIGRAKFEWFLCRSPAAEQKCVRGSRGSWLQSIQRETTG